MEELDNCLINYVETIDDVLEFKRWASLKRDWFSIDTETSGLSPFKEHIRLIQFGDTESGWAMRWDRWSGVALEILRQYEGPMVFQNAKFDVQHIELPVGEKVFDWGRVHDTRVMAHLLQPNKSTSLKALGAQFLSPQARKLQGALQIGMDKNKWGWGDVPVDWPIYWGYGAVDCILTARVAEKFWPEVSTSYLPVYELEMATQRICSEMEVRGFKIDVPYCEEMTEKLTEECRSLEEYCLVTYGVRPSENQAVGRKLRELGIEMPDETPTGEIAVGKAYLEPVGHPLATSVLKYRQKSKVLNSYFKNFLEMHVNGILHCSINTLGARTGRMSIQNPALQTLPRGSVVRDAFIPRAGKALISTDYDAVEMRMFVDFARDPGMIEAISEGDVDVHTAMARIAYNDDSITPKDPRRQIMKNGNFAKVYSAGPSKFAETIGVSLQEAEAFFKMYNSRFPGVDVFQRTVINVGKQRAESDGKAWAKTKMGRLQVADSKDKVYTLVNYLVQGSCADVLKQALVDLDNAGYGEALLLPVHDEVLVEVPTEEAETHMRGISSVMARTDFVVPLTASSEGPFSRWGDKSR